MKIKQNNRCKNFKNRCQDNGLVSQSTLPISESALDIQAISSNSNETQIEILSDGVLVNEPEADNISLLPSNFVNVRLS